MAKRRITVITGTRAEYGLLVPVLKAIDADRDLKLQLVVTGMHLLKRFGASVHEILDDGWRIDARVRLQTNHDDAVSQSVGLGRAMSSFSREFDRLKSDIVLVLGDRIEIFGAAAAAVASGKVLAHIHGGDVATGINDDAYRHAITRLAHLHFVATPGAEQRLLKWGEAPFRVFHTGSPALDGLSELACSDKRMLDDFSGFDTDEKFFIVLQHPSGGSAAQEGRWMAQTLKGCHAQGLHTLMLYPNCDPGFSGIINVAREYSRKKKYRLVKHAPRSIFLGLLQRCAALIGNSSCGIIESGYLNVDVINIGDRQSGRERSGNVVDIDYGSGRVRDALEMILRGQKRKKMREAITLYGHGNSGLQIASVLAKVVFNRKLKQKRIVL